MDEQKIEEVLYKEHLVVAPYLWRVGACLVDMVWVGFLAWDFNMRWLYAIHLGRILESYLVLRFLALCVILHGLYEVVFMGFLGVTIGKLVFHLRVIAFKTLDKPVLTERLKRCFFKEVMFFFPPAYFFKDKFKRAFHDKYARTLVIVSK